MLRKNTAIVITVLMIGNVAVSLQAAPLELFQQFSNTPNDNSAEHRIIDLLHARGLEKSAAADKARALFADAHTPTIYELQQLCERLEGVVTMEQLENVLARRALFEKRVDMTSAEGLVGLLHEATGTAPDAKTMRRLHETVELHRTLHS